MNKPDLDHDTLEFTTLPLKPSLVQGLDALGHVRMTPVLAQSLPALIEGRDLIAQAPTELLGQHTLSLILPVRSRNKMCI